ncbi:MAG TPA: hypothetical protein VM618_11015 [Acidimicrobiia bacterium]|nr:hypothetical protein [Acidimicrobiia bacterium]
MRKLGIIFAIATAATLGFGGSAYADGHEEAVCTAVDGVVGAVVDSGLPLDDTQAGLNETCVQTNTTNGLSPSPLLCGLSKDVGEVVDPALGGAIDDPVHGQVVAGVDGGLEATPLAGVLTTDYPCDGDDPNPPKNNTNNPPTTTGGGGGPAPEVLANNAAADGGLPRTGGPEMLAGLGLGLTSLGALARRFIG